MGNELNGLFKAVINNKFSLLSVLFIVIPCVGVYVVVYEYDYCSIIFAE